MANIPTSGTLRVESAEDKAMLIEYLVDKRIKFFEYLRQMHSSAAPDVGVLWMNTIRIRRADLLTYFNVDAGFVAIATSPPPSSTQPPVSSGNSSAANAAAGSQQKGSSVAGGSFAPLNGQPSSSAFLASSSSAIATGTNGVQPSGAGGNDGLSFTAAAAQQAAGTGGASTPPPGSLGRSAPNSFGAATEMMTMADFPPAPPLTAKVDSSFIRDHTPYWFLLGTSLANLLQSPKLSGPGAEEVFVEAFAQLLMEVELYSEKAGSASKMLAIRALRNYRNDSPSYWNDTEETVVDALPPQPTSQGFNKVLSPWRNCGPQTSQVFFERQCCRCADKSETSGYLRYHFLDIGLAATVSAQTPPAYEAVVGPLCAVLSMAYQRFAAGLVDSPASLRPGVTKKILSIDKKLKHFFFGALSREIAVLAQAKLLQQANFLRLRIFGAYSHADERTFMPVLAPIQREEEERGPGGTESLSQACSPNSL